jgi:hypothetical protein
MNVKTRLALKVAGLAAVTVALGASPALAHDAHVSAVPAAPQATGPAVFLAAELSGRNEVPAADPDGRAVEVVKIQGNTVSFAIAWRNIAAPTAGHIHRGAAGANGPVVVPFFGGALPDSLRAITGSVTVADTALLTALTTTPEQFYANLHNAEFPAGAVRGQLHKLANPVDLTRFLRAGPLVAVNTGDQEVAGGDADGHATAFVSASGRTVRFGFLYGGIAAPTAGHIHQAPVGVNGAVVVPFFAAPMGLPASLNGIAGVVTGLDPKLVGQIARHPDGFYTNLHNAEFPGGAVRGQLFRPGGGGRDADADAAADADTLPEI